MSPSGVALQLSHQIGKLLSSTSETRSVSRAMALYSLFSVRRVLGACAVVLTCCLSIYVFSGAFSTFMGSANDVASLHSDPAKVNAQLEILYVILLSPLSYIIQYVS